jgi:hypothetical protein
VHQRVTPLAQQILDLAKRKSAHLHVNLYGAITDYYEVSIRIDAPRSTPSIALQPEYSLYADFPRPRGSQHGGVRRSDLSKLAGRNAVEVVINGGAQQLIISRDTYPPFVPRFIRARAPLNPGWLFHGNYLASSDHLTTIAAATHRELRHQRQWRLPMIEAVGAQAQQLVTEATADRPTAFLTPAFPHIRGENDSLPPPIF